MALGGFTKIPLLQVVGVGEGGEPTKLLVLDADGKGVGFLDIGSGFVPLSGTEVDKPITGDLEINGDNVYINIIDPLNVAPDGYSVRIYDDGGVGVVETYNNSVRSKQEGGSASYTDLVTGNSIHIEYAGIQANYYIVKTSPNAFAQLGDIASINNTATALSLATLNADYAVQGVGFKVICPTINLIYIKSSLTTWEQFSTTTVV